MQGQRGSPQFGIPQFGGEITDLPQWRNRLAHGTYRQYTVEQCRGCEFEPHLGNKIFLNGLNQYIQSFFTSRRLSHRLVSVKKIKIKNKKGNFCVLV